MASLAERLGSLTVQVTSPDNCIRAVMDNEYSIKVEFRPRTYPQYKEQELEHQISRLATLLMTGRNRGYMQVMEEFDMNVITDPNKGKSPTQRRYLKACNELAIIGSAPEKNIRIKAVGLSDWECRIAPGTIDRLSEEEFLQELRTVTTNFVHRFRAKVSTLKDEHYGLGVREALAKGELPKGPGQYNRAPKQPA